MKSRKVIIAFAIILPILGVLSMFSWASSARKAAYDGAELHTVVRVAKEIPSGTSTEELATYVTTEKVPNDILPSEEDDDGNPVWLSSLDDADDGTTEGILYPGEILTNNRIYTDKERAEDFNVQPGETEVTVKLDGSRGSSKSLTLGDKVTVYASFSPPVVGKEETGAIVYSAVVSRLNGATDPDSKDVKTDETDKDPEQLITIALPPKDAQKVVYAMEFGEVWLALESPETDLTPLGITTVEDLRQTTSGE